MDEQIILIEIKLGRLYNNVGKWHMFKWGTKGKDRVSNSYEMIKNF